MAALASFPFHDSNLSLFSPQILPYKIICELDLNKKIHKFNLFLFFLFLWSSWFLVRFRGICIRYCLTGSVIWIVLIGAGLSTMQKKKPQHNTKQKNKTKKKRKRSNFHFNEKFSLQERHSCFCLFWKVINFQFLLVISKQSQVYQAGEYRKQSSWIDQVK